MQPRSGIKSKNISSSVTKLRRYKQTLEEVLNSLVPIETSWQDAHSKDVVRLIDTLSSTIEKGAGTVGSLLDADFRAGLTAIRLVLDLSKDELETSLRGILGDGIGVKRFKKDRVEYLNALEQLGASEKLEEIASRKVTWKDLLVERLKAGRGAAIKGQTRGRFLEDFAERVIQRVFQHHYDTRCRFVGATGTSTEKADFAIPTREAPRILIEAKAYGATGSKQTDILGEVSRIVHEKRHDTNFLLVTDGVTWNSRRNDLRKLLEMQNDGRITRIYTSSMEDAFESDLKQLQLDHDLMDLE